MNLLEKIHGSYVYNRRVRVPDARALRAAAR